MVDSVFSTQYQRVTDEKMDGKTEC